MRVHIWVADHLSCQCVGKGVQELVCKMQGLWLRVVCARQIKVVDHLPMPMFEVKVQGSGFRVQGFGIWVHCLGYTVQRIEIRDQGLWCQGLGFMVLGFRVWGLWFKVVFVQINLGFMVLGFRVWGLWLKVVFVQIKVVDHLRCQYLGLGLGIQRARN